MTKLARALHAFEDITIRLIVPMGLMFLALKLIDIFAQWWFK